MGAAVPVIPEKATVLLLKTSITGNHEKHIYLPSGSSPWQLASRKVIANTSVQRPLWDLLRTQSAHTNPKHTEICQIYA